VITQAVADALVALESFVRGNWAALLIVAIAIACPIRRKFPPRPAPKPIVALAIMVALSFGWVTAASLLHGVPKPRFHDDFAYLLAADTFVHGHLSYPPHPLWPHFETMHVLQTPRYASKYPPAQSAVLALGILAFGVPLAGVWISVALAAAAVWWALRVWTTPWLAFIGGILVAIHRTMLIWGTTYHGGAIAACAGAVMLGAAGRIIDSPARRDVALLCAGAIVLAFSRPYEGFIYTIGIAVIVLIGGRTREVLRVSALGALILVAGATLLGSYNHAVTGNALVMPHAIYDARYLPVPNFLWEKPRPFPHYGNAELEHLFRVDYWNFYNRERAPGGLREQIDKNLAVIGFSLTGAPANGFANAAWLLMFAPLVMLIPLLREDRKARLLAIVLAIFAFAPFSIIWWLQIHYLAPATAAAAALAMLLLARLASKPRGVLLAAAIVGLFVMSAIVSWIRFVRTPDRSFEERRERIASTLVARGGKHLVIVAPDVFDAVFNAADIDAAPIVWARDLGSDRDAALIRYFRDRTVWQLVNERGTVVVRRYTAPR